MDGIFEIIRWEDDREEVFSTDVYINTRHIGSVLIEESVFLNQASLDEALERTFQICLQLQIPIQQHFKRIHVHSMAGHLEDDWAFSDLALYLLMLNADVHNEVSAQAQAYAITRVFK